MWQEEILEEKTLNHNEKNKQIQAKNLFGDDGAAAGTSQAVTEKNMQSIRKNVMKGQTTPGKVISITGRTKGTTAPSAGKEISDKKTVADQKKKTGRSPRQKQEACRFYACVAMAVFVLFVMGFGVCGLVRALNNAGEMAALVPAQGERVEDNTANEGKTLDVDKLVSTVLDNVTFEAELNPLEDSVASGMIATTEGTDLKVYMGNGTFADELVVMTALSEEDAKQNQKYAGAHLSEMQKQFQDYIPKEAKKIDSAVKVRCGCYVIVCVTSDAKAAKKVIENFIK